jgi:alkanesulfonate monooxygenase SsuD/methylene tetrahydromethanopterin reductase-like flavin-dependent oxidoreductase (luciferase family)
MLAPGKAERATYSGTSASVEGAINLPKPIQQPRLPIMVGGNGPKVTWRLAARYADELNLDNMLPDKLAEMLPTIRERCEEIGRDPKSLALSCLIFWGDLAKSGQARIDRLGRYRDLGVSRVMGLLQDSANHDEALEEFAEDARAAGCELATEADA